jgi:heme/copper-type cytochrome/quinol oxidase subunit 2
MLGSIYAYSAQYDDDKLADLFEAARDAALSQNSRRVDIKLVWLTVVVILAALSLWAIYIMARIRSRSGKINDKRGNMK